MSEIVEPTLKTFPVCRPYANKGWIEYYKVAMKWKEDFEAKLLKQCELCHFSKPPFSCKKHCYQTLTPKEILGIE